MAIRECLIALGSIGERLRVKKVLTWDNQQANACHTFAYHEYGKALTHLKEQLDNDSASKESELQTLIACFLCTVFEFLQGNEGGTLMHLTAGLNILFKVRDPKIAASPSMHQRIFKRELETHKNRLTKDNPLTWTYSKFPIEDYLGIELVRTFSVIQNQVLYWLSLESLSAPLLPFLPYLASGPSDPFYFPSLTEAARSLGHQRELMHTLRRQLISRHPRKSGSTIPFDIEQRRLALIEQLRRWPSTMAELWDRSSLEDQIDEAFEQCVCVLKMNYELTLIMLELYFTNSDHVTPTGTVPKAPTFSQSFENILSLAEPVLLPLDEARTYRIQRAVSVNSSITDETYDNPDAIFLFYIGLIQPLYIVAIKGHNADIRGKAISLLDTAPWREGCWDSSAMAKIATRKLRSANILD